METIYLTVDQIETLYKLSKQSNYGVQVRSTASDDEPLYCNSILTDDSEGFVTISPGGHGPRFNGRGTPQWER